MENPRPASGGIHTGRGTHIRLLGELRVTRAGQTLPLPASKRSRALLGYLVGTASPQTRQHLCDLLWDGPGDPRAELRWSLTKLRPVLDEAALHRIAADRERVAFAAHGATVDIVAVRALLADGVEAADTAALEQAAALMNGEFLDGLELPACYRFHQWCMAEREWYCALRLRILGALLRRLDQEPERALAYARLLIVADPLSEAGHAAVVRQLLAAGRLHDAELHYCQAEKMFRRELGVTPGKELREAAQQLRFTLHQHAEYTRHAREVVPEQEQPQLQPPVPELSENAQQTRMPLVGRDAECKFIRGMVDVLALEANRQEHSGLQLFCGEAGIGKTSLLDALGRYATQSE
ncbi:AfsR/SARP family transcriptional regulator, partial [Undibacterium sp.]|uniref:AfsR/SARP family transcriptional regulator n=1 Tax=Undibacterium sp. TaxID=1914977 RepID=UPI002CF187D2